MRGVISKRGVFTMSFRYDDIGREFTEEELDKRNIVDVAIMDFINKLNPTTKGVIFTRHIVGKVREVLIDIYSNDLKICNERTFYP